MTVKIQTHLTEFLSKVFASTLVLFIVFCSSIQMIQASAQPAAPAPKPVTTITATKLSPTKEDPRIGAITKCSVDKAKNPEALKNDPTAANNFIFECLRDIIRIVITISIILAVMNLMWIGIKFLNTFGNGDALTKELSEKITGFVVGAVILGLFATFIQVINPAALKIDKIFSAQVIADYKCLNKDLKNAVKPVGDCKDTKQGSGPGGANTVGTVSGSQQITDVLKGTDTTAKQNTEQLLVSCNSNVSFVSVAEANVCKNYQNYPASDYTANVKGSTVDGIKQSTIQGDAISGGSYSGITVDGNNISATYTTNVFGKETTAPITLTLLNPEGCKDSQFLTKPEKISFGEKINTNGCKIKISF